jgi:hypothetical protein
MDYSMHVGGRVLANFLAAQGSDLIITARN